MSESPTQIRSLPYGWSFDNYSLEEEIYVKHDHVTTRVFRARDRSTNREVALKILNARNNDPFDPRNDEARFLQEAHLMRRLRHPHILPILDLGFQERVYWIATPYCGRGSLAQHMQSQQHMPLPIRESCQYAIQICHALSFMHLQVPPIIHRDIKPQNMLFADDDQLMVADFGMARIMYGKHLTQQNTAVGTPEFMAPEQWFMRSDGENESIDPRLDVYALGCVLYTMLSGQPPFSGATPQAIGHAHIHKQPKLLNIHNPHVTLGLAIIVQRALQKNPDKRYRSATDFAKALAPFVKE